MPQPYAHNLNTSHNDGTNEIIHASDIDALATHVNQLEVDANAGGPLDLPGHTTSADHDARYLLSTGGTAAHPTISDYVQYTDLGANAATPAAGSHRVFAKSTGLFIKDSTGAVVGPLGTGGGGSGAYQFAPEFQNGPVSGDTARTIVASVGSTSITAVRAIRTGGSGATIDVQKNGVSILSAVLSLTTTSLTSGTLTTNPTAFASGDILSVVVTGITGAVTDIIVSVEGTR